MSVWKFKFVLSGKYVGLSSFSNEPILEPFYDDLEVIAIKDGIVVAKEDNNAHRFWVFQKILERDNLGYVPKTEKTFELQSESKTRVVIIAKQGKSYFIYKYWVLSSSKLGALNLFTKYPPLEFFKTAFNKKELLAKSDHYYDSIKLSNGLFKIRIVHVYEIEEIINEDQDFIRRYMYDSFSWIYINELGQQVSEPK